jgi:hypothetical protein
MSTMPVIHMRVVHMRMTLAAVMAAALVLLLLPSQADAQGSRRAREGTVRSGQVYVPGHWAWNARRGGYEWVPSRWERNRHNDAMVGGGWTFRNGRWGFETGR